MKTIGIVKFCELMVEYANNATPFILFTIASVFMYDKKPILDTAITLIWTNLFLWSIWSVPTIKRIRLEDDNKITRIVVFIAILAIVLMTALATITTL